MVLVMFGVGWGAGGGRFTNRKKGLVWLVMFADFVCITVHIYAFSMQCCRIRPLSKP